MLEIKGILGGLFPSLFNEKWGTAELCRGVLELLDVPLDEYMSPTHKNVRLQKPELVALVKLHVEKEMNGGSQNMDLSDDEDL